LDTFGRCQPTRDGDLLEIHFGYCVSDKLFQLVSRCSYGWTHLGLAIGDLPKSGSPLLDTAKIGILAASIISGVVGYVILRNTPMMVEEEPVVAG